MLLFQCVFVDSTNKLIYTSTDHGKNIIRHSVDFRPFDISFYDDDPRIFLAHDKSDIYLKVCDHILKVYKCYVW